MKVSQIVAAPWNTRTAITEESVRSLAESMKAGGLIQPISICRDTDNACYICYDGNRRLAAARLLGWDEIDANFDPLVSIAGAKVRTVMANNQREADDPLLAAGVIAALLDGGMDEGEIAAKLGKTVAWVRHRRKMIGVSDALKAVANKVTVEALERVAVLPEKAQKAVCKSIESKAKYMGRVGAGDIKYDIERESLDLDAAKFDKGECAKCPKRTGAEADLFGECPADCLGRCFDRLCFNRKTDEHIEAKVAAAVGDSPHEVVKYGWEFPAEADGKKRSKARPCAWVRVDDDEVEVRWGPTKATIEARKAEAEREREERRAAEDAERKRECEIVDKLDEWINVERGEWPAGLIGVITKHRDSEFVIEAAAEKVTGDYKSGPDWAAILAELPEIADCAGLTEADVKYLAEKYADDEDEEEDGE